VTSQAAAASARAHYVAAMEPVPVAPNEQLPEPLEACQLLCRACRNGLRYQRQERSRFPRHFYWCNRCGRRYAAWEAWAPEPSSTGNGGSLT